MSIIIEGPPHVGKSTLAAKLSDALGYPIVTEYTAEPRVIIDGAGGLGLMVANSLEGLPDPGFIDAYRCGDANKRLIGTVTIVLAIYPEDAYLFHERAKQTDDELARTQELNEAYFGLAVGQSELYQDLLPDIDIACLLDEGCPFPVDDISAIVDDEAFLRQRRGN